MKNWSKGDRVTQPNYGPGTLVEVNEHHTVIDFDEQAADCGLWAKLGDLVRPFPVIYGRTLPADAEKRA